MWRIILLTISAFIMGFSFGIIAGSEFWKRQLKKEIRERLKQKN